jgi:hypothetical protein
MKEETPSSREEGAREGFGDEKICVSFDEPRGLLRPCAFSVF